MKEFSWHVFSRSGDLVAYLLYREVFENTQHPPGEEETANAVQSGRDRYPQQ